MSFIYNCTEPLPEEKLKRAQKFPDYNPKVDLCPLPIFVIRKCEGSPNPCRIFVDHTGWYFKLRHSLQCMNNGLLQVVYIIVGNVI